MTRLERTGLNVMVWRRSQWYKLPLALVVVMNEARHGQRRRLSPRWDGKRVGGLVGVPWAGDWVDWKHQHRGLGILGASGARACRG